MRIYLDNCCYNRPYDDQSQIRISLESQAKLHIQELIRSEKIELAASYILTYENSRNLIESKKEAIGRFIEEYTVVYIDSGYSHQVELIAETVQATGVKAADALHTACAIMAKCDYLITTDDRLLRFSDSRIKVVDPTEFIRLTEGGFPQNELL